MVKHDGPSRIDFRTVIFPTPGPILATFLRGAGCSDYLIEAVNGRSLPLQPVSVKVFISFAPSDQDLCRNLREHLSLLVRLRMIVLSYEVVLAPDIHQWEKKTSAAFQERTSTTLDEEIRTLDTQIQSSEGMIVNTMIEWWQNRTII